MPVPPKPPEIAAALADLAPGGVPENVAKRAEFLLKAAERNAPVSQALPLFANAAPLETNENAEIIAELAALEPDRMTPREALDALYALRSRLNSPLVEDAVE